MTAPDEGEGGGLPPAVHRAFPVLDGGFDEESGERGLLHETRYLRTPDGRAFVLQRVSDVFAAEIHDNIEAVTAHLASHGFETFRLEPTREGALFVDVPGGGRWRLMTRLPGTTFHEVRSLAQVESAGALVGRFHAALLDFDAPLAPMGLPFRETALYRTRLSDTLARHAGHPRHAAVVALRERIDEGFGRLGAMPATPLRVIHGDLKISNVLFAGPEPPDSDRARALIDFDTLMRAPLWSEWGDAWRSWCNRRGEDVSDASFDLEIFAASLEGFVRGYGAPLPRVEVDSLLHATERIALELAIRYATDALEASYFAWDATRFADAAEHNLLRAQGQLALFESAWATSAERRSILDETLAVAR